MLQAGPFTPQTPGTMYGSDHTYSPYQPSPAGYLGTPSPAGYSPRSPFEPGEPHAGEWHTTEVRHYSNNRCVSSSGLARRGRSEDALRLYHRTTNYFFTIMSRYDVSKHV